MQGFQQDQTGTVQKILKKMSGEASVAQLLSIVPTYLCITDRGEDLLLIKYLQNQNRTGKNFRAIQGEIGIHQGKKGSFPTSFLAGPNTAIEGQIWRCFFQDEEFFK